MNLYWERVTVGDVVDKSLLDYVQQEKIVLSGVQNVYVFGGDTASMSDYFLVEIEVIL